MGVVSTLLIPGVLSSDGKLGYLIFDLGVKVSHRRLVDDLGVVGRVTVCEELR